MITSPVFQYKGWNLSEAIDALMAYDRGATDSGVGDESMRGAVKSYLLSLDPEQFRIVCAEHARQYLTDEAITDGYGLENVKDFLEWLSEMNFFF